MAKTRQQKEQTVQALVDALKAGKSAVFVNYQGLKVKEADELRRKADKEQIVYTVVKKTLMKRALKNAGTDYDTDKLQGMIGIAVGPDEVSSAKLIAEFGKTHEMLKILGGVVDGSIIDAAGIRALASLPSREQLLGQLVRTINAPVSGFVNVLAATVRSLLNVLNAIQKSRA